MMAVGVSLAAKPETQESVFYNRSPQTMGAQEFCGWECFRVTYAIAEVSPPGGIIILPAPDKGDQPHRTAQATNSQLPSLSNRPTSVAGSSDGFSLMPTGAGSHNARASVTPIRSELASVLHQLGLD
jgi:hypothetical protein